MISVNEIEGIDNVFIMYNHDGSQTIFNDDTGIVIEKNASGTVVSQESCNIYVAAIRGMLRYGMNNFVKAPGHPCLYINKITP